MNIINYERVESISNGKNAPHILYIEEINIDLF